MTFSAVIQHDFGPSVHCLSANSSTIYLVGTAHISKNSELLVRHVIETILPDRVCLELDRRRYYGLCQDNLGQTDNRRKPIRGKQFSLISWLMSSYQRALAGSLGVAPGTELLAGAQTAERLGIPCIFCDRDIQTTLGRARQAMSFGQKMRLIVTLLIVVLRREKLSTEQVSNLQKQDSIASLINEWARAFPALKKVIIDERDIILAENIKAAGGERLVAVVGAGHVAGIIAGLAIDNRSKLAELSTLPTPKPWFAGCQFRP